LKKNVGFGLDPEDVLRHWHTSWQRDPAADRGGIQIKANDTDGELAFSVLLHQDGKPVCAVVQRAFIPGVFSSAGVFDAEERISAVFKGTVLRSLFDQLNAHLRRAFPDAVRRRPRIASHAVLPPMNTMELMDDMPQANDR